MNTNKLVSIITPTYNHEKYIGECIESVLAQTNPYWEMIIIDDGSTDGTGEIVSRYKDSRIKYIRQENKGLYRLAETYNQALNIAQGDFIAILEGDDYWPRYKIETQIKDFNDESVVLSFGSTAVIFDDHEEIVPPKTLPADAKTNTPVGRATLVMMDYRFLTFTFPVSVVMRKNALKKIGGFQQPPYLPIVDYPTFLRLSLEGKFSFHSQILGFWRRHESSATKNNMSHIFDGIFIYIKDFLQEYRDRFTEEEVTAVLQKRETFQSIKWSLLGRRLLYDKEWGNARKVFKKSLSYQGSPFYRTVARGGILLSFLHLSPEKLLSLLGLITIQDILSAHDAVISKEMLRDL